MLEGILVGLQTAFSIQNLLMVIGGCLIGTFIGMLLMMVAYAQLLRTAGFVLSTTGFLVLGAALLGERKFHILIPVALLATGIVWYLVQEVLGIYMRPLPGIFGG